MDAMHRSMHQGGYEETGEEDNGEYWRLSSLSHPKTPHFCRSCMLGFRDRILLNNHLKEHYLENKALQDAEVMIKENTEQEALFRCLNCKQSFVSRNQLKIHCETCLPSNTAWQCEVCEDVFPDKVQLHAHFLALHSSVAGETTQCPHCRLHFESKHDLKAHIQIEHEVDGVPVQYKDDSLVSVACECGKVFLDEVSYQEHVMEHHPASDPMKWPRGNTTQKKRRRVDSGGGRRSVSKRGGYHQSKRGSNPPPPPPPRPIPQQQQQMNPEYFEDGEGGSCVECGMVFSNPADLRRHMQNDHIHLKPYACSICGRRFTRKSDVKRHIETIHGQAVSKEDMERIQAVRPFRCAKCGNPFGRYSDIKKHIEVHHGLVFSPDTYVYQLEHLDESGLSIGSSGEVVNVRTFECGLCKRKYRNKVTVRHHIRRDHNQEDPDAFITRSAYNSHNELECQYCGTAFSCRQEKMDHIQQIHQSGVVDDDSMVLTGVLQQELIQRDDDDEECFMPVKDVNTPEKLAKYASSKNQIVILKQEVINAANASHLQQQEEGDEGQSEMMESPRLRNSAPLDHKNKEATWSNTLINEIVSEQHVQQQPASGNKGRTFDCTECSRTFLRAKALQKHMLKMHSDKGDEFECELCGKSYKEQAQFVKHLQVAHPEVGKKPVQAAAVGGGVKARGKKVKAAVVETPQIYYSCDECEVAFTSEEELVQHLDTEHPDQQHVDDDTTPPADTTTTDTSSPAPTAAKESQVVSSQSVAIDDMPPMEYYTCNVCRTMFSSTESLTRHMNVKHKDLSLVAGNKSGRGAGQRAGKEDQNNMEFT